ncbi:PP2C family protein-serine/threonine phosphatase [Ornithinibacillus halophilus]|uniref:Sigma-B regulation protein RsbU (Phosphoserine phosphatase) n=1 Tax=Ornithinibacillus halophilus TaxID=930117 RepID=A0A1M5IUD9_9BACI|nr:PP2C family protein-serine/threonine phosphatase [Ornithinibacillus halophilus]SHG31886.1 sigma-B regulation protein RsbU (phosphoserine phosphatase) [Ornithinibacillus halophilus]
MDTTKIDASKYKMLLKSYIESQNEQSLYGAEQITKTFIKNNILPEEIVNLHIQALTELYPDLLIEFKHSMNFLLETMISYGLAHQEYQYLREKQSQIKSEISVAANVQDTLLKTTVPQIDELDIGVISVPAHQMNGDYHHFIQGKDGSIGIAIADVIGKGIPAALCMSMIKYAMDSFPEQLMRPNSILENLNRVVERNVDPSMFITMFYAQFDPDSGKLFYSSAGHEPGFLYNAVTKEFQDIEARGLVLGINSDSTYKQYELQLNKGDIVIMLTDGVTECRGGKKFIEREEALDIIRQYIHLPPQEAAEMIYKHFENLQDFNLKDDFTLIILEKKV